jgi:NADPH-dependent 2,4-dienoyl-CoA reductase/sulfur reductase-like enzyme
MIDLAIIGAGAAGMGAAIEATGAGLSVAVLDEQAHTGGQVHRQVSVRASKGWLAGADDRDGLALADAFASSPAQFLAEAAVWQVDRLDDGSGFTLHVSHPDGPRRITCRRLIVATGAHERPVPIPGWTLPGVMSVGAAQIMLKVGRSVPEGRFVIAGQGPLALLYAVQALKAGARPIAILDTSRPGAWARALPHLAGALAGWKQVLRGLGFIRTIRSAGVPIIRAVDDLAAVGSSRLEAVRYRAGGREHQIVADVLLLHEGVIPHCHMTMALGAEHEWNDSDLAWRPCLGEDGTTSIPGVAVAGDGGGIGGWRLAEIEGRLAGLAAAQALGHKVDPLAQVHLRRSAGPHRALRPFLTALYRPRPSLLDPPDEVIICRCEEKSAGEARAALREGCLGPNQVKTFTRIGMGPCQGRSCGTTLTTLIAAHRGITPGEAGFLRIRPPLKPLTLGELAALSVPEAGHAG